MKIKIIIDAFVEYAKQNNIEIYNEFALQFELAIYLRKTLGKEYKVQLERNISFLDLARCSFVKKVMDIVIFRDISNKADIFIIELKAIVKQEIARPIAVFHWIEDLKFLEQLKSKGIENCFSFFLTDNENLFSDNINSRLNTNSRLLPDFRNRKIQGIYYSSNTINSNRKSVTLGSEYTFEWNNFVDRQKCFLVEV